MTTKTASDPLLEQMAEALSEVFADHNAVNYLSWTDRVGSALAAYRERKA